MLVVALAVLVAYGAVWTRGINGDDFCMGELANTQGFLDAVRSWLTNWNSRVFLAVTQLGTYELPLFADPLRSPWYVIHALVLIAHLISSLLLLHLMVRAQITPAAALTAALLFAVHPIVAEPMLWLAASYGYIFGTLLLILAVWSYLEYERSNKGAWLILSLVLSLLAVAGIEQYVVVLGALAATYFLAAVRRKPAHHAWLPLFFSALLALLFVIVHFIALPGTEARTTKVAEKMATMPTQSIPRTIAWNLSLLPEASPYAGRFETGLTSLASSPLQTALVALAALAAAWRIATASAWRGATLVAEPVARHLWLGLTGLGVFAAAMLPFYFVGYGISPRTQYVGLPGLVLVGAALMDLLSNHLAGRNRARWTLAALVAAFVAMSLVINIGDQAYYAEEWEIHRDVLRALESNAIAVREAKAVQLTGLPPPPFAGPSRFDTGWEFPCLVGWLFGEGDIRAWTNLMGPEKPCSGPGGWYCIEWRPTE